MKLPFPKPKHKPSQALQQADTQATARLSQESHLGLHKERTPEQLSQLRAKYADEAGGSILHHPAFKQGLAKELLGYTPRSPRLNGQGLFQTLDSLGVEDSEDLNTLGNIIDELRYERRSSGLPPTEAEAKVLQWLKDKPYHDFLRDFSPAFAPTTASSESPGPVRLPEPAEIESEFESEDEEPEEPAESTPESAAPRKKAKRPSCTSLAPRNGATLELFDKIARQLDIIDDDGRLSLHGREQGKLSGFIQALIDEKVLRSKLSSGKVKRTQAHDFFCYHYKAPEVITPKEKRFDVFKAAREQTIEALSVALKRPPVSASE
jgi:hypothetical protein